MRLALVLILGVLSLYGQICPITRMLPVGDVSGILDNQSCRLSDGSAYTAYRLDLPVRGQIEMELPASNADLILILRSASGAKVDSGVSIRRPVEAGSYTVLVNGRTPGQLGSYSVKTSFTAESSMLCRSFPSAGVNQTANGSLGASGCLMPDNTPYEGYFLKTFGGGVLTVTVTTPNFMPGIIIRTDDGAAIVSAGNTAIVPVDADSRYQIVVYGSEGKGRYEIVTSFQPAEDEGCRSVKTIVEPGIDSGTVGTSGCAGDAGYYNYYDLTVSTAGMADILAASNEFTPTLSLLDDAGNLIASDSGGTAITVSQIRMFLKPGNYTVQVLSTIPSGGAYDLTYGLTAGPPQPCQPVTGTFGEAQSGKLVASSCRSGLGLTDIYGFTLPSPGTLDLNLSATEFPGVLALSDAKDNLIVLDVEHLSADLPAGSYVVGLAAQWGSGPYRLAASVAPHEIRVCNSAQALDVNGGYIQKLGPASCRDANGQPVDYYEFTLPSDSVVAGIMTSSEVDGRLNITDSVGNILRSDDDSYGFRNPLIVQYVREGTYRAEARAASSTLGGYYQVDLRTIPGVRPPFCAPRGTLDSGGSVTGIINFSGCQYPDATFADIYELRLASENTVDLRLDSAEFDAYLVLLDAKGNVVAQNDDGGDGTNARINDILAAGTYYVVAKPSSDYYSAGGYTLWLM